MIDMDSFHSKEAIQAWSASLLLHGLLVLAVVALMPKRTIVLEQEPFRWDVTLVDRMTEEAPAPAVAAAATPSAPVTPRRPTEPVPQAAPETETLRVAPPQSAQMVHPIMEPLKPQPVAPPQPVQPIMEPKPEPTQSVQEVVQAAVKPEPQEVKKPDVQQPEPAATQMAKQEPVKEPVREIAPVTEPAAPISTYQPPAPAAHEPVAESHRESTAVAGLPPAQITEHSVASPAPALTETAPPAVASHAAAAPTGTEAPAQVAKAVPQAGPQTAEPKADHRWVGESLWRRVAELKRYPSVARLNGIEGRVVLKAVIRADGHLAEVSVVKSSGHAVLDNAAMEAVRLACPLHMKQPIGPPQIVVSLPIVYSLTN